MPKLTKDRAKALELAIATCEATAEDFEGMTPREAHELKESIPYREFVVPSSVIRAPTEEQLRSKTVTMVFNTQVADRVGDLVIASPEDAKGWGGEGWKWDRFMFAGGPYLHAHDHNFTVGKTERIWVEQIDIPGEGKGKRKRKAWALLADVRFLDRAELPFSQADYALTLEGLTASSVGYRPHMHVFVDDEEQRVALGLGQWGSIQPDNELLECSKVAVPCNQWSANPKSIVSALKKHVDLGNVDAGVAARYLEIRSESPEDRARRQIRSVVLMDGLELELSCLDGVCTACAPKSDDGGDQPNTEEQPPDGAGANKDAPAPAAPLLEALGAKTVDEGLEEIQRLTSMSPSESAFRRLSPLASHLSGVLDELQDVLDETASGLDVSEVEVDSAAPGEQNEMSLEGLLRAVADRLEQETSDGKTDSGGSEEPGTGGDASTRRSQDVAAALTSEMADDVAQRLGL